MYKYSKSMNNLMPETAYFRTSDFPLVATLSIWLPIIAVDKTDSRRSYFLFERSDQLDVLLEGFNRRTLLVPPEAFYHAMKSVKVRLYEDS